MKNFTSLDEKDLFALQQQALNTRFLLPSTRQNVLEQIAELKKHGFPKPPTAKDLLAFAQEKRAEGDAFRLSRWPDNIPEMYKVKDEAIGNSSVPIRIYYPEQYNELTPAVFFIHGGGFMAQGIFTDDGPVKCFAHYINKIVVQIDYRLAPEHPWPAAAEDVLTVATYLLEQGQQFGIDTKRMVIMGESAGANLSLTTLLALRKQKLALDFVAGVLVCGVYQPAFATTSWRRYGNGGFSVNHESGKLALQCYLTNPLDYLNPEIWPLFADLRNLPALYIAMSSADPLRDDSFMLATQLQALDQEYYLVEWPGALHTGLIEWEQDKVVTGYLKSMADYIINVLQAN